MKVNEAIKLLAYAQQFQIIGSYTGKIYHKSWINRKENLEKYLDWECSESPFFSKVYSDTRRKYDDHIIIRPIIGIWVRDYEYAKRWQLPPEKEVK